MSRRRSSRRRRRRAMVRILLAVAVLLVLAVTGGGFGADGAEDGAVEHGFDGPPRSARADRVERVVDGDTLELARLGRVRLIGVDTPEVYGGRECFGREASSFARRAARPGRRVQVRLGEDPRDRYGRALADVWLADGRFLNGLLVERGYAEPLAIEPNVRYARQLERAARRARRAGAGLWAACAR